MSMKKYKDWTLEEASLHCQDRHDRGVYCDGCELDGVCCEKSRAMVPRYWITEKPLFSEAEVAFAKTFQEACANPVTIRRDSRDLLYWSSDGSQECLLPFRLFPSVKQGQEVQLKDIIGEE